ncbi:isopeptide-forming domain-containing fimbrial protein [Streptomyces sp. NPDC003691]
MRLHSGRRFLAVLALALAATLTLFTAPPPNTAAAAPRAMLSFPVHEPFDSAVGNLGSLTGNASYVSGGWLRLTSAATTQAGGWEMNDSFSTGLGIVAEFTYATYGGATFDGKRGDGLTFFLADGSAANGTGAPGGSLGYACGGGPPCNRGGVPGAFLGIGLDEFGNFSSNAVGNGGPGGQANRIVLRGGGNGNTGYRFGTSAAGPGGTVETQGRGDYRTVRVTVTPSGSRLLVSVWSDTGPGTALTQVITDYDVSTITNQPALPSTLKVGFSGGTGLATNIHEIGDLKINVPADLSVTKTGSPATARAGDPVTYTVTVANSGANDVTGAILRDSVPGLTNVTWTCTATTGSSCVQPSGSGNSITASSNLLRNGSATYTIRGTAPSTAGTLTNTATVFPPTDRTDTNSANDSASATTTVTALADVSVTKAGVGSGPVTPGQTFDYRVTASNAGPSGTTNVRITDTLPAGLTFVSSTDGCTASGQTVTCPTAATMAAGGTQSWTFRVKLADTYTGNGSDLGNTATVSHGVADPNQANNTTSAVTPPGGVTEPRADLRTAKAPVTTTPVSPGQTFDYRVTVTNNGPSVARGVRFTDPLPAALSYVSSTDPSCSASGQTVSCGPAATLAVGASVSWTFRVRIDPAYAADGTALRNTATASATTNDPDLTNNSGTGGVPGGRVTPPTADVTLTKRAD